MDGEDGRCGESKSSLAAAELQHRDVGVTFHFTWRELTDKAMV